MTLSDFTLLLAPAKDAGEGNALRLAIDRGLDFSGRVTTYASPWGASVPYAFSRGGGACHSCRVTPEGILVFVDGHRLRPGHLYADITVRVPDPDFADGYRDIAASVDTGQTLSADTRSVNAEALLPFVDPYAIAAARGYRGTREDYDAALAAVPSVPAAVEKAQRAVEAIEEGEYATKTETDARIADAMNKLADLIDGARAEAERADEKLYVRVSDEANAALAEALQAAIDHADALDAARFKLLPLTAAEYEAIADPDPRTLYIILPDNEQPADN